MIPALVGRTCSIAKAVSERHCLKYVADFSYLVPAFFFHSFPPLSYPFNSLMLNQRDRRIEGERGNIIVSLLSADQGSSSLGQIWSSSVYLISSYIQLLNKLTKSNQQQPITHQQPTLGSPNIIYPLKCSQNCECPTTAETICNWQNHALARAWGES